MTRPPPEGFATAGPSLVELLATIPDPRKPRGRIHPLTAVPPLAAVAMLAGMKSPEAIARFGRDHGAGPAHALGFRRKKAPAKSALREIFRALDPGAFEAALRAGVQGRAAAGEAVALDGKALRGSRDGDVPGAHLLAAFVPASAAVPGQVRVDARANEHQAALRLWGVLPLRGKVVSGGAMRTHRDFAQAARGGGGDYLSFVKDDQPELKAQTEAALHGGAAWSPLPAPAEGGGGQEARAAGRGHGRREYRRLTSTAALNGYVDWPDVGQVFELERVRVVGTEAAVGVVHGITSLGRERADAARLLQLARGHWGVEDGLHYVRDVTPGEGACRVRTGAAPRALAALRNAVVHLLGGVKATSKAAATRYVAARPFAALALLFT